MGKITKQLIRTAKVSAPQVNFGTVGSNGEQNLLWQVQIQSDNICELEKVKDYIYLELLAELHKILKLKKVASKIKIRIYKTVIRQTNI